MLEGGLIGLAAVAIFILLSNPAQTQKAAQVRLISFVIIFITVGVLIGGAVSGQLF